ncbi:MAG: hypothetical protein K0Q72_1271 [Armatimonadetes bacterium]|jgi:hypothetical protein|nr:hypothetical protein [Armatimonadota bacterium]
MPVVTEKEAVEGRKRSGKALYLLLVPPLLGFLLVAAAVIRPVELQLGPAVIIVLTARTAPTAAQVDGRLLPAGTPVEIRGHEYAVMGTGWGGGAVAGGWGIGICWFRGHRK